MNGIDVSENNGDVDWQAVADSGQEFAIIRLGWGNRHLDCKFADNVNGAIAAGLKIGVYYYSYAMTPEEAKAEAEFVKEILQEYGVTPELGVWFDMEDADGYKDRHGIPDNQTITDMCKVFTDTVAATGYQCGVYASYSWLTDRIDLSQLPGILVWNAQWGNSNDLGSKVWQYTDSLDIGGRLFDADEYYE